MNQLYVFFVSWFFMFNFNLILELGNSREQYRSLFFWGNKEGVSKCSEDDYCRTNGDAFGRSGDVANACRNNRES